MTDSTLKEDIRAALQKERDRLWTTTITWTEEDAHRYGQCVEAIKNINQSDDHNPVTISIERVFGPPFRL